MCMTHIFLLDIILTLSPFFLTVPSVLFIYSFFQIQFFTICHNVQERCYWNIHIFGSLVPLSLLYYNVLDQVQYSQIDGINMPPSTAWKVVYNKCRIFDEKKYL